MKNLSVLIKPVSSACNMRCKYCFYADVAAHREHASMGIMSDTTLDNLVRKAFASGADNITFAFQGGEPTLAGTEFFSKLISLQKKYNSRGAKVNNSIQTNGYNISDELLDLFARENFLVGISFDGTPEIHDLMRIDAAGGGTSSAVESTIKRMQERNIAFNILCVVNSNVARNSEKCFNYLKKYGYIQFIACIDGFDSPTAEYALNAEDYSSFLKKIFDLYYKEYKQGKYISIRNFDNYLGIIAGYQPENCAMCGRCALYYVIEADGSVYPCDFYVLDEWKMGNINDASFLKLSKSTVAAQFAAASLNISHECRDCKWYGLCRGGCRRDREPVTNCIPSLNKWCKCYKELFEYAYPRMMEMVKQK